jgi:hypothetical protein
MPTYPDGHEGAWPVDADTGIGRFRLLTGDADGVEYDPAAPGYRSFEVSDADISGYLSQSEDSVTKAIAFHYLTLAGAAANEAVSIQDMDLRIDKTKRSAELRAMAEFWLGQADGDDVIAGEEAFEIVPTGRASGGFIPEGSPAIWGRVYTWERWR